MSSFSYDMTDNHKAEFLPAKCVIHFRPKDNWKGEGYGFDWMRLGDTGIFGDTKPYKDIVSKQKHTAKTKGTNRYIYVGSVISGQEYVNEHNGDFSDVYHTLYNELKKDYIQFIVPWKKALGQDDEYFCSWLSLYPQTVKKMTGKFKPRQEENVYSFDADKDNYSIFATEDKEEHYPNTTAELRLLLDIEEIPDYLEFGDNEYLKVTPPKITQDLKKGKYFWNNGATIKIECKSEFYNDQKIDVFFVRENKYTGKDERKLAGRLYVWANYKTRRKTCNAIFVRITTPSLSGLGELTGNTDGQEELLNRYLSQALIQVNCKAVLDLDLSSDPKFKAGTKDSYISGNKIDSNKTTGFFPTPKSLAKYLGEQLQEQLEKEGKNKNLYDNILKIFYFEEEAATVGGYYDPSTHDIVMFQNTNPTAVVHEFLHRCLLPHSFTNQECTDESGVCTYKAFETENIMDYTTSNSPQLLYSLWHWQWKIANRNA